MGASSFLVLLLIAVHSLAYVDGINSAVKTPTAEQYKVKGLERYGAVDDMYSGYIPLDLKTNTEGSYFFWLAKQRKSSKFAAKKESLVVWLNGGPGCSSMVGMMWENGYRISIYFVSKHVYNIGLSRSKILQNHRLLTLFTAPSQAGTQTPEPTAAPSSLPGGYTLPPYVPIPITTLPPIPPFEPLPPVKIPPEPTKKQPTKPPVAANPTAPPVSEAPVDPAPAPPAVEPAPAPPTDTAPAPPADAATPVEPSDPAAGSPAPVQPSEPAADPQTQTDLPFSPLIPRTTATATVAAQTISRAPHNHLRSSPATATATAATSPAIKTTANNNNNNFPVADVDWVAGNSGISVPGNVPGNVGPIPDETTSGSGTATPTETPKKGYNLKYNPWAWNEAAHVLFVEQPIRTGFSKAATGAHEITNEDQVGDDFYSFLQSFLTIFPEYQGMPVFITGESYGGMYIPWISETIVRNQEDPKYRAKHADALHINLKGAAIGNGVIDEVTQDSSYPEYAYTHGLIPLGAKLYAENKHDKCLAKVQSKGRITHGDLGKCDTLGLVLDMAGKPNEYNVNTFKQYDMVMKPDGAFNRFFNDPEIQQILNVRGYDLPGLNFKPDQGASLSKGSSNYFAPDKWEVCRDNTNDAFGADYHVESVSAIKYISQYIRVLLYSGEFDINTNLLGTIRVLEKNTWQGKAWSSAVRSLWFYNGDIAGEYYNLSPKFSYLVVRNSGHLLPMDIPDIALDMLQRFLNADTFADTLLPSGDFYGDMKFDSSQSSFDGEEEGKDKNKGSAGLFLLVVGCLAMTSGVTLFVVRQIRSARKPQYTPIVSPSSMSMDAPLSSTSVSSYQQTSATTATKPTIVPVSTGPKPRVGGVPEVQSDGSVQLRAWMPTTIKKLATQPLPKSSSSSTGIGYKSGGYQVIGQIEE